MLKESILCNHTFNALVLAMQMAWASILHRQPAMYF
jgi:hypothetical protein